MAITYRTITLLQCRLECRKKREDIVVTVLPLYSFNK